MSAVPTELVRTWGAEWAAAMVKAQRSFPVIAKSADVEVQPRQGRAYSYSYAPLDVVIKKVQGVLGECGLAVVQDEWVEPCEMVDQDGKPLVGSNVFVMSTVVHESGQYREYRPLSHRGADLRIHDLGSILSYLRRYSFLCALRLAPADEDDDGKSEMEKPQARAAQPAKWTGSDTRKATEAAKRIIAAVDDGRDVMEYWDEITPAGEEFVRAVWTSLPQAVKNLIKDEDAKRKAAA